MRTLLLSILSIALAAPSRGQDLSVYVPTKDGTRLAVDVHLPAERAPEERVPALLEFTRYWRSSEDLRTGKPGPSLGAIERGFLAAGYAVVKIDVRGTGASFGTRGSEYGPTEVHDSRDVIDWVARQPWCDGAVGAHGISYTGTTAELATTVGHPALRAVVVGWSDFDIYRSPARPYGLYAATLIDAWSEMVAQLDRNDGARLGASVRRVDEDEDGSLLRAAVAEHRGNVNVAVAARAAEFRDQDFGDASWIEVSPLSWKGAIEKSEVPMLVLASWFDSGTAEAALRRFQHFSNPQKVVILASNHGGAFHASPYTVSRRLVPARPSPAEQLEMRVAFFDHHLRGEANEVPEWPAIRYFHTGEEELRSSSTWPPAHSARRRLYLAREGALEDEAPRARHVDEYEVDFEVGSGESNRWSTQMGGPVLGLDEREEMVERMLVYTSALLEQDLDLSGTPVVHLRLAVDREDCVVLAYLSDVEPDGRSRTLTEGGLRARHRRLEDHPALDDGLPWSSFEEQDSQAMVPGEEVELTFRLLPISARIRAGHALRLALAGADVDCFARIPSAGEVTLSVSSGGETPSFLELPVVDAAY